ncbi:MAG: hypothetical protein N2508_12505 [Anaerolineae bacterium]|nr:hypothetical protein [Anaerolineae bacterium]
MSEQPVIIEHIAHYVRQEYEARCAMFNAQPPVTRHFCEAQGRLVAEAVTIPQPQVRFRLPDRVVILSGEGEARSADVPPALREQVVGGLTKRLSRVSPGEVFRRSLSALVQSPEQAVAVAAGLIQHAAAIHMVYEMLPAGRSVTYVPDVDGEIPSIPVSDGAEPGSALMEATDAQVEEGAAEEGRGELQVPYVPAARRFYLPQWVAFDEQDRLLVGSLEEAEAHIASMRRFVAVLHAAVAVAPYIVADAEYQRKRYGMLGQLINQGRALARYYTRRIISKIKERAAAQSLNRGLSLSLPYFDDQVLDMKMREMRIIPAGRIMFVPAFVVRAMREEQAKVAQDTRLSPSTRRHLLAELKMIEEAFMDSGG